MTTTHPSIFDNKEQYLAFRAKWKALHAEEFHKPIKEVYECGTLRKSLETGRFEYDSTGYFMVSRLTAWHHLVFNLAIGRNPPSKAFGLRTSDDSKWSSRPRLWHALNYTHGASHNFLPFGDTISESQQKIILQKIEVYKDSI